MGPTVWELDGPIPILKISNALNMAPPPDGLFLSFFLILTAIDKPRLQYLMKITPSIKEAAHLHHVIYYDVKNREIIDIYAVIGMCSLFHGKIALKGLRGIQSP
jgi:hypothetical protein